MGNTRKPKRPDLALEHEALHQRVAALRSEGMEVDEWTDEPAADYKPETLAWIMDKLINDDQRVNAYHCDTCSEVVVTIDKHPGVTPALVSHDTFGAECEGVTTSAWYRVRQEFAIYATHEWYRPSATELARHDVGDRVAAGIREHVGQGGLLLRRIPAGSLTVEESLLRLDTPRTNQLRLEVRGRQVGKFRDMEREQALQRLRAQAQAAEAQVKRATGGYRG